jgi:hypothetical protein
MIGWLILLIPIGAPQQTRRASLWEVIRMMRPLVVAGAILWLAAPAFAQSTTTIEKKTITKEEVPGAGSTVSTTIIAPTAPPAPQAETPPPPPGPRMVWTPGHWGWERDKYSWVAGKYLEPPPEHAAWAPGRWVQRPDGWVWQEGHWD